MRPLGTRRLAALGASLLLAGCAHFSARSYERPGVDLRQYRTYAWGLPDTFSTGDPRLDNNRIFDDLVRLRIERALAGKSLQKDASDSADLLVHYHASVSQRIDVRNLDPESGYCEEANCEPYVYDAGTLIIDFFDRQTYVLVWRGWAEGSVEGVIDRQDTMEARIGEAVSRILDRFPYGSR